MQESHKPAAGRTPRALERAGPEPGERLVVLGDAPLDRVVVGAGMHQTPHRVGGLLDALRMDAGPHLVDQRQLEALDLLLGGAFPELGERDALTMAKRLRRTIGSVIGRARVLHSDKGGCSGVGAPP